jgi:pyrimidine operon attenuation protein/uracil phosphoribosyltransferase
MLNLTLLDGQKFQITLQRLCRQLIENHNDFSNSVLIGIQPRGIYLAKRIADELRKILPDASIQQGDLDITVTILGAGKTRWCQTVQKLILLLKAKR